MIQWKGYTLDDNSWEPTKNLNCPDKIKELRKGTNNVTNQLRNHWTSTEAVGEKLDW
jgi:hypothetical protein